MGPFGFRNTHPESKVYWKRSPADMIAWRQGERKQNEPVSQIQTDHSASIGVRLRLMCFGKKLRISGCFFKVLVYLNLISPPSCDRSVVICRFKASLQGLLFHLLWKGTQTWMWMAKWKCWPNTEKIATCGRLFSVFFYLKWLSFEVNSDSICKSPHGSVFS